MKEAQLAGLIFEAGGHRRWRRANLAARWNVADAPLERGGFLRVVGLAETWECVACGEEHDVEEADAAFMWCPVAGKVSLCDCDLTELAFDNDRWFRAIGAALELSPPIEVSSGLLWRFPRPQTAGWRKQIWITRGLEDKGSFEIVVRELRAAGRTAKWLLCASDIPRASGAALGAEVIRFFDCLQISEQGILTLDFEGVVGKRKRSKGRPGRTPKVGPAMEIWRERSCGSDRSPVLAEEARAIHAELAHRFPSAEHPSVRTIEDAIRNEHSKVFGRHRPRETG